MSMSNGCFMRSSLIFACLLGGFASIAPTADRYVATNGTDSGACLTWDTAASNIQFAVNLATSVGDTVLVSNGVYYLTNQITITNRITVKGFNGLSNTLVAADWPTWTTRCFYVAATGTVDGFTISNGHWCGSNNYSGGGGAFVNSSGLVQNCSFVNNICSNAGNYAGGGGVYVTNGIIDNCIFFANRSLITTTRTTAGPGKGGGIECQDRSKVLNCLIISNYSDERGGGIGAPEVKNTGIISNCVIIYNYGYNGGGGISGGTALRVVDCIISNNTASTGGGGISTWGATVLNCTIVNNTNTTVNGGGGVYINYGGIVSNCVISGNSVQRNGGGIYMVAQSASYLQQVIGCRIFNNVCGVGWIGNYAGGGVAITNSGQVRNCLIYNNTNLSSTGCGGGVFLANACSAFTNTTYGLINCTIVNNYSTNEGGGIAAFCESNYIVNCIIDGNSSSSGNYPNVYNTDANSNNYYYSCATGVVFAPLQGNITTAPAFKDSGAGNWRLSSGSPCVNTGTNHGWIGAVDLDGKKRIRYGIVDMGAFEMIYNGTIYKF